MGDNELAERTLFDLSQQVGAALKTHGLVLATAESCTGGWVGEAVTSVPGSSHWYDRGFITYTNISKQEMLGVSARTLASHGAVSEETVREMALGTLQHSHAHIALAISGIAGPGGDVPGKPLGTVCFAWCLAGEKPSSETRNFSGDRTAVRRHAVIHALRGILHLVGGLSLNGTQLDKEKAIQLLRLAKVSHLMWLGHATELVNGLAVADSKAPVMHSDCEFGHWYYGEGKELLGYLERYKLVDEAHCILHGIYRDIYAAIKHGDMQTAMASLQELVQTSQSLLDAIDLLAQEVAEMPE